MPTYVITVQSVYDEVLVVRAANREAALDKFKDGGGLKIDQLLSFNRSLTDQADMSLDDVEVY